MTPAATILATRTLLNPADDPNLAQRFVGNQHEMFDQLVASYQQRVARLASRLLGPGGDADDVAQDVFLTVYQKIDRFRGDCSLWTWMTTITVNHCRSRQRRITLFNRIRLNFVRSKTGPPASDPLMHDESMQHVRRAVDQLPIRDREVIVLHYLEGHRTAQIATMLNATVNTIEVRLHRARQKLKTQLAGLAEGLNYE